MRFVRSIAFALVIGSALLVACREEPPPIATQPPVATLPPQEEVEPAGTPIEEPTAAASPTAEPVEEPTAAATAPAGDGLPPAVAYDLGEVTIIQANFPEDSRFRNMPVRLNGVMATPEGEGPFPVVVILHGTHPGCPLDDAGVDRWPCDPAVEQPNYSGFAYLAQELAARGYVALSLNINAHNTFGFGEPVGGERLVQVLDHHLSALAEAAAGGDNDFGVDLAGVPDMARLVLMGHSHGAEAASWLAGDAADSPGLASPLTLANYGYGPVRGLLLIAPAAAVFEPGAVDAPTAVILSGCDGDVIDLSGQIFYERARFHATNAPTTSVVLEGANHNGFNTILGGDIAGSMDRIDCEPLLEPEAQRQFLVDYAADFLTTIFDGDPNAQLEAQARMGLDATAPAPAELYGRPVRVSALAAGTDRRPIFIPDGEAGLTTHALGGEVTAEGVTTHFCPEGYFIAEEDPGGDPCRRPTVTVPGYPAMAVVSWAEPAASLRFALPEGSRDLSRFTALSLRAAVDPLSPLNAAGAPQGFSVWLTDGTGQTAVVATRPEEPALRYPVGTVSDSDFFGPAFMGLAPLTTLRLPLADFVGVDLTNVTEITLMFDQTAGGVLFLGDLELIQPPAIIGARSLLLQNADGANDGLKGIARFNGQSSCTGTFIAPGNDPDAPAYLLTNGHCAQPWDANQVFIDQPAGEGWSATFNYFVDVAAEAITVPAARVTYSTMKGRDVAFVELAATVGELTAQGIAAHPVADAYPEGVFGLRVVGAPVTGVPAEVAFLREERCLATGRADLFEFIWHFHDATRNACQDIYGGSSGSPTFVGDDPAIIGLINTTTIGGVTPCALGSPCEVRPEGPVWLPDTSYVTPVAGLGACFTETGLFDLTAPGCPLDDGRQLLITGHPTQGTQNPVTVGDETTPATWNATVAGELPYYRYKTGRAGAVDCRVDEGYGPVIALADNALIDDPLPAEEGSYVLCVVAGESATVDDAWQPVEWATMVHAIVDNTPPVIRPQLSARSFPEGGIVFEPLFAPPELADFRVKFGPLDETDCADPEGYLIYRRIPFSIPDEAVPARVCVIGLDSPGNAGEAHEFILGRQ